MEPKVIVIGDLMLDVAFRGTCTRIAQEACIPIVNVNDSEMSYSLGGAGNVYANLLNIGVPTQLISVCGNDDNCRNINTKLKEMRDAFETHFHREPPNNCIVCDPFRCTTRKHRFYVNNKIVFRYDTENTHDIGSDISDIIMMNIRNNIQKCKIIIISDYNKGVMTAQLTKSIVEFAKEHHIKVFIDPKLKDITKYHGCFCVKPNKVEGEIICGHTIGKDNMKQSVSEICDIVQCDVCLLTLGDDGMIIFDKANDVVRYANTCHENIIDVTGAGDVVLSSFVYHYMKTNNLVDAMFFSNYCGQLKIKNLGTYILKPYDVLMYGKYCKDNNVGEHEKLILPDDLGGTISTLRDAHKKIVFANGCFDILHYGHLQFLESAKKYGDILIVALNTDESIKQLKGIERPINNLEHRLKQMCMVNAVDFVIVFSESTPYELIKQIHPDVLVKGGDYDRDSIIGKEFAKETIILNYNIGYSTTNIIHSIKN